MSERDLDQAMRNQMQLRQDIVNLAPRCPWVGRIPDASEFDQAYVPYAATTLPEPEAGERG